MCKENILFVILSILIFLMMLSEISHGKDRCQDFIPDIRQYALEYLGPNYPYWYNVGCAMAETTCRSNLVSFDGGIGLFQLTPSTGITIELSKYIPVDPYDAKSSVRAQAFYMHLIKDVKFNSDNVVFKKHAVNPKNYVSHCGLNLADMYRFYNSGYWFFYESTRKENVKFVCDNDEMKKYCVRGGTYTDKAKTKWLSFCDVSYSYPVKVFNFSKQYKVLPDQMNYWSNVKVEIQPVVDEPVVEKEETKEILKPYPGALPPPVTVDPVNTKGDETFSSNKPVYLFDLIKLFCI